MIPIKLVNAHQKAARHAELMHTYLKNYKNGKPLKAIDTWLKSLFGSSADYMGILTSDPIKMERLVRRFHASGITLADELQELKRIYKRFRSPSSTPIKSAPGVIYDGFAFCTLIDVSVCP